MGIIKEVKMRILTKEQQESLDDLLKNIDKINLDELPKIDFDKINLLSREEYIHSWKEHIKHLYEITK